MEKRIRAYEHEVEVILKRWSHLTEKQKQGWRRYHREMVHDFQHERSIHLAVTLFFAGLGLLLLFCSAWLLCVSDFYWAGVWPIVAATVIVWVVVAFYLKHYYFLENHIQGLYKYNLEFYLG